MSDAMSANGGTSVRFRTRSPHQPALDISSSGDEPYHLWFHQLRHSPELG